MVKSLENGTSLPPFLVKCYEMVNDDSTNELISWADSNDSFIIWNESKFSSQLLPKYFKHSNFSSFVRQLNIYGFRKIDTDNWQFANEFFIKGQKHLLKNIVRRKQSQSVVQKKTSQEKETDPDLQSEGDKQIALWKEVESLKTDKNALALELKKLRQNQETSQSKMLILRRQLKGMEKNQQQMLSFIVLAMQSPEFMAQFFQPKENSWRMSETGKSKLSEVIDDCEPNPPEGMIVRYQPPQDVLLQPVCTTEAGTGKTKLSEITDDLEPSSSDGMIVTYQPPQDVLPQPVGTTEASEYADLMELDFSSDEMRNLLMDIDLLLGPMDEKLLHWENHGELVLPDISENDSMLEQLLSNPSTENELPAEPEGGTHIGSSLHFGSTFQPKEFDKSNGLADDANEHQNQITEDTTFQSTVDGTSEKVEVLTKQLGSLTSEIISNH